MLPLGVHDLPELPYRGFQFFPSCFPSLNHLTSTTPFSAFQFFPSCFRAGGLRQQLACYCLSILSQLLPHKATDVGLLPQGVESFNSFPVASGPGGAEDKGRGAPFQFFPSCFTASAGGTADAGARSPFNSFPVASEPRAAGERRLAPLPFNSFPVASCKGEGGERQAAAAVAFQFFPSCFWEETRAEDIDPVLP